MKDVGASQPKTVNSCTWKIVSRVYCFCAFVPCHATRRRRHLEIKTSKEIYYLIAVLEILGDSPFA